MNMLSSDSWKHDNLIRLSHVFHSPSQILLQMEDGGRKSLFAYLRKRQWLPLSFEKVTSIIAQCSTAVCHMHLGPKIVHRDIKPENFVVAETVNGPIVKLCDFGLARIMESSKSCSTACGTFPFIAPELTKASTYDPFAADIWSMGMVHLEVLCFLDVLCSVITKEVVGVRKPSNSQEKKTFLTVIHDFLQPPGRLEDLFMTNMRAELKEHDMTEVLTLLQGMLDVNPYTRWSADAIQPKLDSITNSAHRSVPVATDVEPERHIPVSLQSQDHQHQQGRGGSQMNDLIPFGMQASICVGCN
jgi:serine/threonine protein kinase